MTVEQNRDPENQISETYGDTIIATLRGIYGATFAPDCQPTDMLSDVLGKLDKPSMKRLVDDHEAGRLNGKLVEQA